jgi:Domain of unknown function (DUF4386)
LSAGRIGAASGILSPVLVVVGFAVHGPFPAEGDSARKIAHYYSVHAGSARIWAGGYVEFLGYLVFLPFAAWLWSTLRDAEGEGGWLAATWLSGAVVFLAMGLSSFAAFAAALHHGRELDAQELTTLTAAGSWAYFLSWPAAAVALGGAAAVALRTSVLPRWLAWLGALFSLVLLVAVPLRLAGVDALFLAWGAAVGAVQLRRRA